MAFLLTQVALLLAITAMAFLLTLLAITARKLTGRKRNNLSSLDRTLASVSITPTDHITEYLPSYASIEHSSPSAPITKLPNELLFLIFELLCRTPTALQWDPYDQHIPWPLRLSAVCAQWRAIILSNPSFWSKILVTFSKWRNTPSSLLKIYLERSKNSTLTVIMSLTKREDAPPTLLRSQAQNHLSHPAFQALIREAHRWRALRVVGEVSSDLDFLRRSKTTIPSCPNLESLDIDGFTVIREHLILDLVPMPKLVSLLVYNGSSFDPSSYTQWKQLTTIDLCGAHNVWYALQHCPNLRDLRLCVDDQLKLSDIPNTAIHHRSLQNFTLFIKPLYGVIPTLPGTEVLERLLSTFTFPSLVSLRVERDSVSNSAVPGYEAHAVMFNRALMTAFIRRCNCTLQTLSLINLSISDIDLIGFLHKIPSLVKLTIHEPWFDNNFATTHPSPISSFFFQNLYVSHETETWRTLLPNLEFLSLIVHAGFDETRFAKVINSRCSGAQGVARLRQLRVHVGGMGGRLGTMLNLNKLEPLALARKQGLALEVVNKTSIVEDCSILWDHELLEWILYLRG